MNIWVLIPAYNASDSLAALLDGVKRECRNILVVDDGSTDNTSAVAKSLGCQVLRNPQNYGKGDALRRGIQYLLEHEDFEYLVFMDADGQHLPKDLSKFVDKANGAIDFVVGNRMYEPVGMPFIRVWTNKVMSEILSNIAGQAIADSQCGFRMVKRAVLKKMNLQMSRFEIESEMLIKAARLGVRIESMPIKCVYLPSVKSRINPVTDTIRFIRFLFTLKRQVM